MIYGVGTDLVEIGRVKRMLETQTGERFLQRILHPRELELAEGRKARLAEFAAGRFAAKEAVVKALGCGIGSAAGFHDIAILPDQFGKPLCALSEQTKNKLSLPDGLRIHVTISHSNSHALAFAVVEVDSP